MILIRQQVAYKALPQYFPLSRFQTCLTKILHINHLRCYLCQHIYLHSCQCLPSWTQRTISTSHTFTNLTVTATFQCTSVVRKLTPPTARCEVGPMSLHWLQQEIQASSAVFTTCLLRTQCFTLQLTYFLWVSQRGEWQWRCESSNHVLHFCWWDSITDEGLRHISVKLFLSRLTKQKTLPIN